jgi:Tfp pilus assembly protein PilF
MKTFLLALGVSVMLFGFSAPILAQGDVRSATGLPIPIGEPVIWGQVELRGLKPNETRPNVVITLTINGAQIARTDTNDKGFYVFRRQRAADGAVLQVSVGGVDVGRHMISPGGGDRYDMALDWREGSRPGSPGVISAKGVYGDRTDANEKLFDRASAAAKSKDKANAARLFKELVTSDPKDFVAWTELGSLYFEQSKYSEAADAYLKAIALKPDYMVALMNLGKLFMADKAYTQAVSVFEKAVATEPQSADAYHYLGEGYLQIKQGSKAVGVLNEALRLAPVEKAEIHLRLAALYNAANLKDRAANEYKLFLQKKPDHPEKSKIEKYIRDNQ